MKATLPLALALGFAFGAACVPCRSRGDCEAGEYCDFDTGDCRLGCTSDDDCGGISFCNLSTGSCNLPFTPAADAGPADTGTSSVADAGS